MAGAVVYFLTLFLLAGFVLYAIYRITMDVSAIRALLENTLASQEERSN